MLQEETSIPGSDLNLVYLSSRAAGYKPVLKVTMTQTSIPFNLMKVSHSVQQVVLDFKPSNADLCCGFYVDRFTSWLQWWGGSSRNGSLLNPICPTPSSGTRRTPMDRECTGYQRQWVSLRGLKVSTLQHIQFDNIYVNIDDYI